MKFSRKCTKCQSNRVFEILNTKIHGGLVFDKWGTKQVGLDKYVCLECGYIEQYAHFSPKVLKWANDKLFEQKSETDDYDEFV